MLYYEEEEFTKAKKIYKEIALADGIKLGSFNFDEEVKNLASKVQHHQHVEPGLMDFLRHRIIRTNLIIFLVFYLT